MNNSPEARTSQRLPSGILPSPRLLRRQPTLGVLPPRSEAKAKPGRLRSDWHNRRSTPRKSTGRGAQELHPWCQNRGLGGTVQSGTTACAIVCNETRVYARVCTHPRICANRVTRCTCVHMFANSCESVDGKMCNVPVRGKPRPLHYRPYSRFALDGILLCEAVGDRCGQGARHAEC